MTESLVSRAGLVATELRRARGPLQRGRGLIGTSVPADFALHLPRTRQVHTFGMVLPLDVVFCDRRMQIVHIARRLPPRRVSRWIRSCSEIFELAAGGADGLSVGDRLEIVAQVRER